MKTQYHGVEAFITKDGSIIRELMHPVVHKAQGVARQSLAEAIVPAGGRTLLHHHWQTEELYHVTAGEGRMTLGDRQFMVSAGDTVCIPPGTAHCIENTGAGELKILCCCTPAYTHQDTELLG
jgi:mannose-6-phosphate isomerase-like protein (cupin superfamily)